LFHNSLSSIQHHVNNWQIFLQFTKFPVLLVKIISTLTEWLHIWLNKYLFIYSYLYISVLENLRITELVKNFPAFYGTRRFINMFTRPCYCFLSWVRCVPSTIYKPILVRVFILSTYLCLVLSSVLIPSGFPTEIFYAFLTVPMRDLCSTNHIYVDLIKCISYEAIHYTVFSGFLPLPPT